LWNNLFELLKTPNRIEMKCLQVIRVLTRDKTYLNETINEDQFDCLLDAASIGAENVQHRPNDIQTESLKILCNLVFQSPKCQELCLKNSAVEGILKRLRTYKDHHVDYDIKFFDMKLLFLITALTPNVRTKVRDDYHGLVYLVETLDLMMKNSTNGGKSFDQPEINLINEILKVLFNITVTNPTTIETEEDDEQHLHRLSIVLHDLLLFEAKAAEGTEEYHSNIINLLTNIPIACFMELIPQTNGPAPSSPARDDETFENFNMHSINIFLNFLELKLNKIFGPTIPKDYEQLPPILTVMIKCIRCSSVIRRYVRGCVLPPLCDVKKRPEEGTTVRNHLCKLLTYPSTQISDLVAELLFVLCKENVGRMIKYTGYGNAAGLFAKRGLLGGRNSENQQQYSSDSEDSDTEEYKELQHGINPVIGCFEPPKKNPLEGMSEEQVSLAEHHLADIFSKSSITFPERIRSRETRKSHRSAPPPRHR
jgi:Guanine nucleotide exchange factor synembryn